MFKIFLTGFLAASFALSISGNAFALFQDLELIRVVYERTTGSTEQVTNLGNVKTILAGGTQTFAGAALSANNATNLYAVYFAIDRTGTLGAAGPDLWVSGSTTVAPAMVGTFGFNTTKSATTSMFVYYNSLGTTGVLTGSQADSNSYRLKVSQNKGALANGINTATRANTEISLASLIGATSGSVTQYLYFVENGNLANSKGVAVATITTNLDGSTTISAAPAAATVPDAPTIGTATATGDGLASITFIEPASNGGSPISLYTVTSNPGNIIGTGVASPVDVLGLLSGTAYTFTVTAINAVGTSAASAASNSITTSTAQTLEPQTIGTISFTPTTLAVGGTTTASATATSNLTVTFSSTTPDVCSVSSSTVTGVAAGACTIAANQAGDTSYNAAPQVTHNITVDAAGLADQTLAFTNPGAQTFGTSPTLTATATSGLIPSFTSATTGICTITTGGALTFITPGTCTVNADQAGNGSYNAAPQVPQSFTVNKADQTITFTNPDTQSYGTTPTLTATATSNLTPTFTSATPSICAITSGGALTLITPGTCTVNADQAGNGSYNAAPQVPQSFIVNKADQTITFTNPGTQSYGTTPTLTATATSNLTPTFTSATPSICAITSGGALTLITPGTCTVNADQAGNGSYNAAPQVPQSFTAGKAGQSIGTISFTPATLVVGGSTTASATASSGLVVTFSSTTPSVCTVSGSTVTAVTSGTCTVAANQAGDVNYDPALQVTQNITIGKTDQSIGAITFTPATLAVGGSTVASATATSGLAVTFISTTPSVCTVSGSAVTGVTAGTCTITADQTGNATYNQASQVTLNITVGKGDQTILSFSFTPNSVNVGGTTAASATATSALAVTFSSTTPSVCTVSGSTVTSVTAGTCTVAANQTGNTNYNAASQVTKDITAGFTGQSISTITFTPTPLTVGGTTAASATATSGLAVIFSSTTPSVCTVSGSTVTSVTAGTCTVAANQAGNATYNSASQVTQNITVGKTGQSIGTITFIPATLTIGGITVTNATATSGLAVTFSSTTPAICTISGSTVTGVASGTCTVAANQAGNVNFNAASQVTQDITVGKTSQTIGTITFAPATLTVGSTTAASATATSGFAVTFSSTTPAVCTASGSTVTGVTSGTCTIAANQAGNVNFNAASQVTQDITVGKTSQSIGTITFTPATLTVGSTTAASATATSGFAITFSSTTPAVCSISGSIVTGVTAGTCTVAANQAGNVNFNAASQVTQDIIVGKTSQSIGTITFTPATLAVGGTTAASATATSALAVTFSSTTPAICTVSGLTITGVTAGTCTVAANQSGNANYYPALQVTRDITVGKGSQTIGTITFAPVTLTVAGTTTANATASSGLGVIFTSTTPAVCSVNDATVTGTGSGTCTIAANQAGNSLYSAAVQVTQSITVAAISPGAPTLITATSGNSQATIVFTAPAFTGGSTITGYTVTSSPGGFTGTGSASPITVTGLTNGTPYTFTVKAANAAGSSVSSTVSNSVTPATLPGAPTIATAAAGNAQATVTFTAPTSTGGSTITSYTVTSTPGGFIGTDTASPITVTGLTNGTAYTFTVTATNSIGSSPASVKSNSVTPVLPPIAFTVFPAFGANGKINPATNQTVNAGDKTTITVTPDSGYQISSVTGCGGTLSGTIYTTAGMIRDCSVSATFIAIPKVKGDLNSKDGVTIADALLALQFAIGLKTPTAAELAAGDVAPIVNGKSAPDGKIDIADAVAILQYSVGSLKSW